jgi:hypothetical protein
MKRACDRCINRKVKCDGGQPCQRCVAGQPQISCTFLKLARKRGPKPSNKRFRTRHSSEHPLTSEIHRNTYFGAENPNEQERRYGELGEQPLQDGVVSCSAEAVPIITTSYSFDNLSNCTSTTVPHSVSESNSPDDRPHNGVPLRLLRAVIAEYRSRMYPVWPVVDVNKLIKQLQEPNRNQDIYVLATSLCAATMAQLHFSPAEDSYTSFTSEDMERECTRARLACDYREQPNLSHVLVSFFLHVYHAKMDRRNAALLYVQEALSLARVLKLADTSICNVEPESLVDKRILYLLLWVSERCVVRFETWLLDCLLSSLRGYAIQHALPISSNNTISVPSLELYEGNIYAQGLVNLATLFVAFDSSCVPRFSRYGKFPLSSEQLMAVEKTLVDTPLPSPRFDIVQRLDFFVTKQWMRILLWQQAMSRGLLSSSSYAKSMTFLFPAQIASDLLEWMVLISTENLMPLGRDQVKTVVFIFKLKLTYSSW